MIPKGYLISKDYKKASCSDSGGIALYAKSSDLTKYALYTAGLIAGGFVTGQIGRSAFYCLNKDEAAIIVKYRLEDFLPRLDLNLHFLGLGRGDIANVSEIDLPIEPKIDGRPMKFYGAHPLGELERIVTHDSPPLIPLSIFGLPNIYWHLPFIQEHHVIKLTGNQFELEVPIMASLGQNRYLVLTRQGFKVFHLYDFKPKAIGEGYQSPNIIYLKIKGTYDVKDIEKYAILHKLNNWHAEASIVEMLDRIADGQSAGTGVVGNILWGLITGHEDYAKIESAPPEERGKILAKIMADIASYIQNKPDILLAYLDEICDKVEDSKGIDILTGADKYGTYARSGLEAALFEDKSSKVRFLKG